jgi:hypothetical protein
MPVVACDSRPKGVRSEFLILKRGTADERKGAAILRFSITLPDIVCVLLQNLSGTIVDKAGELRAPHGNITVLEDDIRSSGVDGRRLQISAIAC